MAFYYSVSFLSCIIVLAILPINAQIVTSPCTATMLTSFTPCLNFLANGNGTAAPSAGCCNALRTMMGNGSACLCVIATGGIPFQIPINPNTTMSLPRACNMARVPLQCKASTPPAAAPGPAGTEAPSASPTLAPSPSPSPKGTTDFKPMSPALAPQADVVPTVTPISPSATNSGRRQNPNTPSAAPSVGYGFSPLALIAAFGAIAFMLY
ncbi:non-specific lipid transfer protein GPI-anchored 20-like [Solanum dulcamara]|uniref:non-specific lipid transfer protein GPI-anchored 20-like n=1 Tax=Solanum dulcamara TaxID=45834 RepID=UPI00248510EA|nr:non-specific lipid transfer protein GPI-anchored 20-like [Solanum dulcamara]